MNLNLQSADGAWKVMPLESLIESARRGLTYSADMLADSDSGIAYVNMKSFLKGGGFNNDGLKRFNGPFADADLVASHDLLIANTDVTLDGDIVGVPVLLPDLLADQRVLFSHHVTRLRLKNDIIPQYLYYLLCLDEYRGWMKKYSRGTTVLMLDQHAMKRIPIRLPKRTSEQKIISDKLAIIDGLITQTEALITKYQQIKTGLMHDLFTRGVIKDGKLRPPREEAPELYKKSPIGWIPKEWDCGGLVEYLDPANGIKPGPFGSSLTKASYSMSGYRVYGQEQVIGGSLDIGDYYISEAKFREMKTFEVLPGDVLLSLVGTIGCILVAKPPFEPGIINPRLMRLRPAANKVSADFLKSLLLSWAIRRQLESWAGGGTMPVLNGKMIRRLRVPLVSIDEQDEICKRLAAINERINSETIKLKKMTQQKRGLMHDLLTGRVRVKTALLPRED